MKRVKTQQLGNKMQTQLLRLVEEARLYLTEEDIYSSINFEQLRLKIMNLELPMETAKSGKKEMAFLQRMRGLLVPLSEIAKFDNTSSPEEIVADIVNLAMARNQAVDPKISVAKKFRPSGMKTNDTKTTQVVFDLLPTTRSIGVGFDARYGSLLKEILRFSPFGGMEQTIDIGIKRKKFVSPRALVIDEINLANERYNLKYYLSGRPRAESICARFGYVGIGSCVLNSEVRDADELAANGIVFVVAESLVAINDVHLTHSIDSLEKMKSPLLARLGCSFTAQNGISMENRPRKLPCDLRTHKLADGKWCPKPQENKLREEMSISCSRVNRVKPPSCGKCKDFQNPLNSCPLVFDESKSAKDVGLKIDEIIGLAFEDDHPIDFEGVLGEDDASEGHMRLARFDGKSTLKNLAEYIVQLSEVSNLNFAMEGSPTLPSSDFLSSLFKLPDCRIEYIQVADDSDFRSIGAGIFTQLPSEALPVTDGSSDVSKVPLCNNADVKELELFTRMYGTHFTTSARTGGILQTTYQIARDSVVAADSRGIERTMAAFIRELRSQQFLVREPTVTIMERVARDYMTFHKKNEYQKGRRPGSDIIEDGEGESVDDRLIEEREDGENKENGEASRVVEPQFVVGNLRGEKLELMRPLLEPELGTSSKTRTVPSDVGSVHESAGESTKADSPKDPPKDPPKSPRVVRVTNKVIGGKNLPVSQMGGSGAPWTLQEIQKWKSSLMLSPGQVKTSVLGISEMLKHPLVIRAAFLFCGPRGAIGPRSAWWEKEDGQKPTTRSMAFWGRILADMFSSRKFSSVPSWEYLQYSGCGKMLMRKFYLIQNYGVYALAKAETFYSKHFQATNTYYVVKLKEIQLQRMYFEFERQVQDAQRESISTGIAPSIHDEWEMLVSFVERGGDPIGILQPVIDFLLLQNQFEEECSKLCSTRREIFIREQLAGARYNTMKVRAQKSHSVAKVRNEKNGMFSIDRVFSQNEIAGSSATSPKEEKSTGQEEARKAGVAAALERRPRDLKMMAQTLVSSCEKKCFERKTRMTASLDELYTEEQQRIRQIFRSFLSLSRLHCREMVRLELDPTSKMIDTGDDGHPASLYCSDLPSILETKFCMAVKDFVLQRLAVSANVPRHTILRSHRLLYMVDELLRRNPDFVRLQYMTFDVDAIPEVPPAMAPSKIREEGIMNRQKQRQVEDVKDSPIRSMGKKLTDEAEQKQLKDKFANFASWDADFKAAEVCRMVVGATDPSASKISFNRFLDDMWGDRSEDPAKWQEKYDTQWHFSRQKIIELQREKESARDKGPGALQNIEALLRKEGEKLWCDHYLMEMANRNEELEKNEENRRLARCYVCVRSFRGNDQTEVCSGFPSDADFDEVDVKAGDKLATKDVRDPRAAGVIVDKWGFEPNRKIFCNGALITPKKADENLVEQMKELLLGPKFSSEDCQFTIEEIESVARRKRKLLATLMGYAPTETESKKCAEMKECEEADRDCINAQLECNRVLFTAFKRLHAQAFDTVSGKVKREFQSFASLFKTYGNIGSTPCVDIGMCSDDQEVSIKTWLRGSTDANEVAKIIIGALPNRSEKDGPIQAPGALFPAQTKDIAKQYHQKWVSNPNYVALARQEKKNT
eukprot:g269.t1